MVRSMHPPSPGPAARALSEYLKVRQLTQRQLADQLDVTEGAIAHLLAGRRFPGRDLAVKIERLTGIAVAGWVCD